MYVCMFVCMRWDEELGGTMVGFEFIFLNVFLFFFHCTVESRLCA